MGTDPATPDYEPGKRCPTCEDTLFGGVTPKYVEARFVGIVCCPGIPGPAPNRVFLLEQNAVNPCQWDAGFPIDIFRWRLEAARSYLLLMEGGFNWFNSYPHLTCLDFFLNENVCSINLAVGFSGFAQVFWGPTIGP